MAASTRPRNWERIVIHIKTRADYQCECGTIWDCGSSRHASRCVAEEGKRYQHNGREVKLRVVQIGPADDWRPEYLVALCLPCLRVYEERRVARQQERERVKVLEAQMDSLFPTESFERKTHYGYREQN